MKSLNFERAIMIILAFQLIEASVRRGDYGGRANQGRKLGTEGVYAKQGWACSVVLSYFYPKEVVGYP